jgi:peptidoglycan/LPS O-acetylase OafA/YrhL
MGTRLSTFSRNRDNNFNLIRFIAAALVLYSHSYPIALGIGHADPLYRTIGMSWGTIAVDVFFVTSGFLIAGSFFSRASLTAFVWARVLRIYPALIVALLFCVFVVGLAFTTLPAYDYLSDPKTHRFLTKNVTLLSAIRYHLPGVFADLPYPKAVNGSLWTLPYEIEMYAWLAILGSALRYAHGRFGWHVVKPSFLVIALTALAASLADHFHPFESTHFIRLFCMFFLGVGVYVYRGHIYLSTRLFLAFTVVLLLSTADQDAFFVVYSLTLPYLVFYAAYVPSGAIRRFNQAGDYSYGIYIYAFPVQQSVAHLMPGVSVPTLLLAAFAATLVLAYLSWHLIEKQCLSRKGDYAWIEKAFRRLRPTKANAQG